MILPQDSLEKVLQRFSCETFFSPIMGFEIEFYIEGACDAAVIAALESAIGYSLEEEKGAGQFEIKIPHSSNIVAVVGELQQVKERLVQTAHAHQLVVRFDAMPYDNQPGSGLHVHINVYDAHSDTYPFQKPGDDLESVWLRYAVAGLLELMPASMPYFAPDQRSMMRYVGGYDAPATISWGGNNRTVALRLPTTTGAPMTRRIEHRVPAASADPHSVVMCILEGIRHGMSRQLEPVSDKIYGNAALEQYGLEPIYCAEMALIV